MVSSLYEIIGVSRDADQETIKAAVERFGRQAGVLANTAPERAQQMREQSRAAKIRLLSGDEARQRYDRDLQVIEEAERRKEAGAAGADRPFVLLDPSLRNIATDAVKIIRAGLYTKAASRLGSELNKERRRPAPTGPPATAAPGTAASGPPPPPVQPDVAG